MLVITKKVKPNFLQHLQLKMVVLYFFLEDSIMTDNQVEDINENVANIAEEILKLANLGEQLNQSRLKQKAVILLLHDISKVKKTDIMYILNSLPSLKDYVRP